MTLTETLEEYEPENSCQGWQNQHGADKLVVLPFEKRRSRGRRAELDIDDCSWQELMENARARRKPTDNQTKGLRAQPDQSPEA